MWSRVHCLLQKWKSIGCESWQVVLVHPALTFYFITFTLFKCQNHLELVFYHAQSLIQIMMLKSPLLLYIPLIWRWGTVPLQAGASECRVNCGPGHAWGPITSNSHHIVGPIGISIPRRSPLFGQPLKSDPTYKLKQSGSLSTLAATWNPHHP